MTLAVDFYGVRVSHLEGADPNMFRFTETDAAVEAFGMGSRILSVAIPLDKLSPTLMPGIRLRRGGPARQCRGICPRRNIPRRAWLGPKLVTFVLEDAVDRGAMDATRRHAAEQNRRRPTCIEVFRKAKLIPPR